MALPESITAGATGHLAHHEEIHKHLNGHFPSLLVASGTAPQDVKDAADYVCDGTADQTEINAALAALPATGGSVVCWGLFNLTAPVTVTGHGQTLAGIGTGQRSNASQASTGTKFKVVTGFTGSEAVRVQLTANDAPAHGVTLRDFTVDGDNIGTNVDGVLFRSHTAHIDHVHVGRMTGTGIRLRGYNTTEAPPNGWATYDTFLTNLFVTDCLGTGIWFDTFAQDMHLVGAVVDACQNGLRVGAGSQQITGVHTYSNTDYNVWFDSAGSRTKIVNLKCEQAGKHGLFLDGTTSGTSDVMVVGSNFKNNGTSATNTYDHVHIGGTGTHSRPTIVGCNFTWTTGNLPRYGVNASSSATQQLVLAGCNFGSASHFGTAAVNLASSATVTAAGNQMPNAKTANGGVASVANGGTITHGLARTPDVYSATATVAGHIAVVTAVSGTTLTVGLHNHDGAAVAAAENVAWHAEI